MSLMHSPSIVTSGLTLCLDAANPKSYPGSGTTWTDVSANGNTGTLQNTPTFDNTNGGLINFNGSNQYISSTSTNSTDITGSLTCEIWFKLNAGASDWVRIYGKGTGPNRTWGLWYNTTGSSRFLYQRYGASNLDLTYIVTINTGVWYQLVGVSNGTSHVLYLNSVSVATTTTASATFNTSVQGYTVGAAFTMNAYHNGPIASVKLYNVALSADQVLQNYNALRGRFGV